MGDHYRWYIAVPSVVTTTWSLQKNAELKRAAVRWSRVAYAAEGANYHTCILAVSASALEVLLQYIRRFRSGHTLTLTLNKKKNAKFENRKLYISPTYEDAPISTKFCNSVHLTNSQSFNILMVLIGVIVSALEWCKVCPFL